MLPVLGLVTALSQPMASTVRLLLPMLSAFKHILHSVLNGVLALQPWPTFSLLLLTHAPPPAVCHVHTGVDEPIRSIPASINVSHQPWNLCRSARRGCPSTRFSNVWICKSCCENHSRRGTVGGGSVDSDTAANERPFPLFGLLQICCEGSRIIPVPGAFPAANKRPAGAGERGGANGGERKRHDAERI